ncbi:hypothetical protein PthstB1num2_22510 [Parageobacillus thermoglucosidasius]|nr:hypothetical protein PthstB1num2_22510 [Parageobacillus thermoglucosidasius]
MNLSHLHFHLDDRAAVLEKMAFRQSKTFIPNVGGLQIAVVQSLQIRFECPEEHFLAMKRENYLLSFLIGWVSYKTYVRFCESKISRFISPLLRLEEGRLLGKMLKTKAGGIWGFSFPSSLFPTIYQNFISTLAGVFLFSFYNFKVNFATHSTWAVCGNISTGWI